MQDFELHQPQAQKDDRCPLRTIAAAVIGQALRDSKRDQEATNFLLGYGPYADISNLWFSAIDMEPLTMEKLKAAWETFDRRSEPLERKRDTPTEIRAKIRALQKLLAERSHDQSERKRIRARIGEQKRKLRKLNEAV